MKRILAAAVIFALAFVQVSPANGQAELIGVISGTLSGPSGPSLA